MKIHVMLTFLVQLIPSIRDASGISRKKKTVAALK